VDLSPVLHGNPAYLTAFRVTSSGISVTSFRIDALETVTRHRSADSYPQRTLVRIHNMFLYRSGCCGTILFCRNIAAIYCSGTGIAAENRFQFCHDQ